jgi:hypothetical protein
VIKLLEKICKKKKLTHVGGGCDLMNSSRLVALSGAMAASMEA